MGYKHRKKWVDPEVLERKRRKREERRAYDRLFDRYSRAVLLFIMLGAASAILLFNVNPREPMKGDRLTRSEREAYVRNTIAVKAREALRERGVTDLMLYVPGVAGLVVSVVGVWWSFRATARLEPPRRGREKDTAEGAG